MPITIPNSFTPGTVIASASVNANFTALGAAAVNVAGDTLTGNLLAAAAVTIDGVDISANVQPSVTSGLIGATGKIPALTAPYFTSLDGAAITGILAAAVGTGSPTFTGPVTAPNFRGGEVTIVGTAGNNNNLAIGTATHLRFDSTAGVADLTGFASGAAGRLLVVTNVGASNITLGVNTTSSTVGNRIATATAAIGAGGGATLIYDGTSLVWRIVGV